jgi:uncharacterized protein YuzE
MRLDYDLDADALYIAVHEGTVARTVEIDDETLVDLDADGLLVGIEVVSFRRAWPLNAILDRYDVPAEDAKQLIHLFPVRGATERSEAPQMSVTQELAAV